jgi:hypothetical protein
MKLFSPRYIHSVEVNNNNYTPVSMGAAEFDGDNFKTNLQKIIKDISDYNVYYLNLPNGTIYYYCHKAKAEEYKKILYRLVSFEPNNRKKFIFLKRSIYIKEIYEKKSFIAYTKENLWLDYNHEVLFSLDFNLLNKFITIAMVQN